MCVILDFCVEKSIFLSKLLQLNGNVSINNLDPALIFAYLKVFSLFLRIL